MERLSSKQRPAFFMAFLIILGGILPVTVGCDSSSERNPQEVAQRFLVDLRSRETEEALKSVWPPTRQKLEQTYEELVEAVDGSVDFEVDDLLVAKRVYGTYLLSRSDVVGEVPQEPTQGDAVQVKLEFRDDRSATLTLRWGDGRWYVDLPLEESEVLKIPEGPETSRQADEDEVEQLQQMPAPVDEEMSSDD